MVDKACIKKNVELKLKLKVPQIDPFFENYKNDRLLGVASIRNAFSPI